MKPNKILFVFSYAVLVPAGVLVVAAAVLGIVRFGVWAGGSEYGAVVAIIALMAIVGGIGGAAQYDAKHGETDDQHTD